ADTLTCVSSTVAVGAGSGTTGAGSAEADEPTPARSSSETEIAVVVGRPLRRIAPNRVMADVLRCGSRVEGRLARGHSVFVRYTCPDARRRAPVASERTSVAVRCPGTSGCDA